MTLPRSLVLKGAVILVYLPHPPDMPVNRCSSSHERCRELEFADYSALDRCSALLTDDELNRLGVKLMPGYKDPYHKRPMKRGEIGCFLSHYNIWKEVVDKNYDIAMILEDDVRFEPFFTRKMVYLIEELKRLPFQWDLVYLGRKRLQEKEEQQVTGTDYLVWAGYSYWTLGYLLSGQGAKKLIAQDPLSNIIPVDEYLPILYDKHPEDEWKNFFPIRNLIALSVEPLVLYPAWYLHEEGYVSDTEDSPTITTTPRTEL
nr:glycosyltransferase 25 family member-like [Halyomorpha halys]